jgi:hypothetical protein
MFMANFSCHVGYSQEPSTLSTSGLPDLVQLGPYKLIMENIHLDFVTPGNVGGTEGNESSAAMSSSGFASASNSSGTTTTSKKAGEGQPDVFLWSFSFDRQVHEGISGSTALKHDKRNNQSDGLVTWRI